MRSLVLPSNPTVQDCLYFERLNSLEDHSIDGTHSVLPTGLSARLKELFEVHESLYQADFKGFKSEQFTVSLLLREAKELTERVLTTKVEEDGYWRPVAEIDLFLRRTREIVKTTRHHIPDRFKNKTYHVFPDSLGNPGLGDEIARKLEEQFHRKSDYQVLCVYQTAQEVYRGKWWAIRLVQGIGGDSRPLVQVEEMAHMHYELTPSIKLLAASDCFSWRGHKGTHKIDSFQNGKYHLIEHAGAFQINTCMYFTGLAEFRNIVNRSLSCFVDKPKH